MSNEVSELVERIVADHKLATIEDRRALRAALKVSRTTQWRIEKARGITPTVCLGDAERFDSRAYLAKVLGG